MSQILPDPAQLAEFRSDPNAIVPERALVFEVTGVLSDFYKAAHTVEGLEFLGEEEGDIDATEDWRVTDKEGKPVPMRLYFTIPDRRALEEIVSLWRRFQAGEPFPHGKGTWKGVFSHLSDVRVWGPKDRLSASTIESWEESLAASPNDPICLEVEFWFRDGRDRRRQSEASFLTELELVGGRLLDRADIEPIRYHAVLVTIPAAAIRELIAHPLIGLASRDDIKSLVPQAVVRHDALDADDLSAPFDASIDVEDLRPPVAALFDGLPMGNHELLENVLEIDDPDDLSSQYGQAKEQVHGTAMASVILYGDLNGVSPSIRHRLYVRPVMYPQQFLPGVRRETMPPGKLGVDLIWRAFQRMLEGESGQPATAPTVRIVNLSLGDSTKRFAGVMSPWARLVDYLSWRYGVLILVSAGNVCDPIPLPDVSRWGNFEAESLEERQRQIVASIIRHRAQRRLFSPSEAINAVTVGACHDDLAPPSGTAVMATTPYGNANLPNPTSALGLGFRRAVKPEILMPGGREQLQSSRTHAPIQVQPVGSPVRFYGVKAAASGTSGQINDTRLFSGTSVATALATHWAVRILENLYELPRGREYPRVEDRYHSVILKALLVHGARWDGTAAEFLKGLIDPDGEMHHEHWKEEIGRFLGYGRPELERALGCTEQRATLVGWGSLRDKDTNRYRVPLPVSLEGMPGYRAVTVTVGWLTPLNVNHRMYRMAQLSAAPGSDKKFSLGVANAQGQPSHNAVGRGTIFHRRWEGEEAATFTEGGDFSLDITCKATAGDLDVEIPYGVAVTIEVGQAVAVEVYNEIRTRILAGVRVPAV